MQSSQLSSSACGALDCRWLSPGRVDRSCRKKVLSDRRWHPAACRVLVQQEASPRDKGLLLSRQAALLPNSGHSQVGVVSPTSGLCPAALRRPRFALSVLARRLSGPHTSPCLTVEYQAHSRCSSINAYERELDAVRREYLGGEALRDEGHLSVE